MGHIHSFHFHLKDSLPQEAGQILDFREPSAWWRVGPATDGGSKGQCGCWACLSTSQRWSGVRPWFPVSNFLYESLTGTSSLPSQACMHTTLRGKGRHRDM